jgi:AcrR family transcriptional regulator
MPRRVDHGVRRRQIIEALCRIAVRGGLSAATFREVAAEADVSVRLVQYYFGSKAELLHAANAFVGQRSAARLARRIRRLGADPAPYDVVRAAVRSFLPTDQEARENMVLFYAFYNAQLTDPSLARGEASSVPRGLVRLVTHQVRRAQEQGEVAADVDAAHEASILTAAIPSLVSGVLVHYMSAAEVSRTLDRAVDRLFRRRLDG